MPPPLLLSVKDAMVRYSEVPLFENLGFNIHQGSRIALVGRNGAGKSTLMNIITGTQEMDAGERWQEVGVTIGYLQQDIVPQKGQSVYDYIFTTIAEAERDLHAYKVDIVTDALELDPKAMMTHLSGGQLRRAGLARALVEEPDILLLDEPTNHLDLEAIQWLEDYLKAYRGTMLCVSHDKTFLANVTNQIFWLDRGQLKVCGKGFGYFDEWATMLMEQEARELQNRKQMVALEVDWASRGVPARRKRNQQRLEKVKQMRAKLEADESAFRRTNAKIQMKAPPDFENSSKIVSEFYNVYKGFGEGENRKTILDKFSLRIARGDRIGVLGRNGSGKTTFLRLLIGEQEPDQGRVKRRKELEFSYFDQKRKDLNLTDSLRKTLAPGGGEYIDVMGKQRHVCGYLKDFMFDPAASHDKVATLSGGQKNRLMLAKILANPKTCLILDEPTNDLDMDTLEMLEDILSQYTGTLIVVSHDRDFLDQTVTKILAFEGDGVVETHIGGYSDYLERKKAQEDPPQKKEAAPAPKKQSAVQETVADVAEKPVVKFTYPMRHELAKLPEKIAQMEEEVAAFSKALADPDFYQRDKDGFHDMTKKLADAQARLERYESRWLELEELQIHSLAANGNSG